MKLRKFRGVVEFETLSGLGEVLLAHSVRLAEGRVVLGDLVLEGRDLLLELGSLARVGFDIGPQPLDHAVRLGDRGCLVLTCGFHGAVRF